MENFFSKKSFSASEARKVSEEAKIEIESQRQKLILKETEELNRRAWDCIKSAIAKGRTDVDIQSTSNLTHNNPMQPESIKNVTRILKDEGFQVSSYDKLNTLSIYW
jgi:hypothetical protein